MISRIVITLFIVTNLYSQAIITLVVPPGSNVEGLGEAGVTSSKNLSSLYHNPAILSSLYDYSESRFHFQKFRNDLLPTLYIEGLDQEYTAVGFSSESIYGIANLGIGYFKNKVSFGRERLPDTSLFEPYETVEAFTISLRILNYLGIGYNFKWVNSVLLPPTELDSVGAKAKVKTRDIGLLLSHKYTFPFHGLYIEPALGVTFVNTDDSVHYGDPNFMDPIPLERWTSFTIRGGYLELAEVAYTQDRKINLLGEDNPHTDHFGVQLTTTPFLVFSTGYLDDDPGERHETHFSWTIRFDFNKTLVFLNRIKGLDFVTPYSKLKKESAILDWRFMPNFVMEYSESHIEDHGGGIRGGQKSYQIYLSI